MITDLLVTKLFVPPPRLNLVARPHLVQRLEDGVRQGSRLTLLSAPAGFGKTTLVTTWLHGAGRPLAWLSLDEGDNDPVRFFTYLIAALQTTQPRIGQAARSLLGAPQQPPLESLITMLVNDLAAVPGPLVLVLDDLQLIAAPPIYQALAFLLASQPPNLHVVLITRADPPLALPRLRARGQMTELREQDLRFTLEEAIAFLGQTMGLALTPADAQSLEARTEGWIAGLQLAALAIQRDPANAPTFIASFSGADRYVMDYLVAEVLQRQPPAIRDFMQRTAVLERLTAPLCDFMVERSDSQAVLEQLEAANLFVLPLDNQRAWYRYHRILAGVLQATLNPGAQQAQHTRAMHWYKDHGLAEQAIPHALAYAALSGDTSAAAQLIEAAAEQTLLRGGLVTVLGWLDALPEAQVRARRGLAIYKGWALALSGEIAAAAEYATAAAAISATEERRPADEGQLLALQSWNTLLGQRAYDEAIALARAALQALPEALRPWRVITLWVLAESLERTTPIPNAIEGFRQARQAGLSLGHHVFLATVEMSLALALNNNGQRQEAIAACQEALQRYTDEHGRPLPMASLIYSRLGLLYLEANELEQAWEYHERAIALSQQLAYVRDMTFSHGLAVPTLYALGQTEAAIAALHKAYRFVEETGYADVNYFRGWEAHIRLQQGDLAFALRWAQEAGLSTEVAPDYLHIEQHILLARLLLAQDRLEEARRWLARLESFTRERALFRWLITVHILQALAEERLSNLAAAHAALAQAVRLAAPEGYARAFFDEDDRVLALLPAARHAAPALVARLLEMAHGPRPGVRPAQPLAEPLSERELEVLRLIAAGLSNQEIAGRLVIAVSTVKRHINHIYGKLAVQSRTQAVARARSLGLLS